MRTMAKRASKTQSDFKHTWFLQEWMQLAGKKQADMLRELGWSKAKASEVFNGQQYKQDLLDELAPWLHCRPYELLLHPARAMALRAFEENARAVASQPAEPTLDQAATSNPDRRRA